MKREKMLNNLSDKIKNNKKLNKKENEIIETIIDVLIFSIKSDNFDTISIEEQKQLIDDKIKYINSLSEIECSEYLTTIVNNYFNQI